ncbi:small ribosomal subunit protein mS33 isoform X2 [Nerophis lumbriciformis]|uniref:small ribosomal subunit protein mS33 isoform X2 n=1 Tax=Nerophis lumbriciformis TaxID=546530 RepID=UPI002AE08064|nr:small ribosomal subunit protein mS33-like isoform X2 [Nerophis lumbriciformis]
MTDFIFYLRNLTLLAKFYLHKCMPGLSNYALRMSRLSAQIFGNVVRTTDSRSMKVVDLFREPPFAKKKDVYDWYPLHNVYYAMTKKLRFMGLFRDEHEDFKEEMRRLRKLRGKGVPKKGEGKRATKKK